MSEKPKYSQNSASQYAFGLEDQQKKTNLLKILSDYFETDQVYCSFFKFDPLWVSDESKCIDPFFDLNSSPNSLGISNPRETLFIGDTSADDRTNQHPSVKKDNGIKLYMRAPIENDSGVCLGVVCILSSHFRTISGFDKSLLKRVAKQLSYLFSFEEAMTLVPDSIEKINENKKDIEVLKYCSDLGIWKWDLKTNDVSFDERWCEIIGYKQNEVAPNFSIFEELVHPDDLAGVIENVQNYLANKIDLYEVIFRIKHKLGHWITILAKGKVFKDDQDEPVLFCGTHFDMSYIQQVEDKAKDFQRLSGEIQRMGQIGGWEFDVINNSLIWTDETYRIYGLPVGEEIDVENSINYYLPHERSRVRKHFESCLNGEKTYFGEFEFQDAKGAKKWVRSYGEPICTKLGEVVKVMGTFQDISYQKELEVSLRNKNADLKNKEKDLKTMIDSTYDGIWDWHLESDFQYMSPRYWEILGFEAHEKEHKPSEWKKLIFSEDLPIVLSNFALHVESRGKVPFFQEVRFRHKNGSMVWVLLRGQVVEWAKGGLPIRMTGAHTDITDLKKAQINLQESSKLIALGEMAGGVAHEINNPLAIINSSAEALARIMKKNNFDHPMGLKFINNIQGTVSRISKIVDGLKKLSRHGDQGDVEVCPIHDVIMDSLSLSSEKFRSNGVELSLELYENYDVWCRPVELSQVIINLLNNAYHAVQNQHDACVTLSLVAKDSDLLSIEIKDNGPGIPEHLIDKIMEPFFTTKPVGEGTGLGLSISREIIETMGGRLSLIKSEVGACFQVDLKRVRKKKKSGVA